MEEKTTQVPATTNVNVNVEDKRGFVSKIWSKHKKLIMIAGAVVVGYYAWKKYGKK